jgi:Lipase (class 3)
MDKSRSMKAFGLFHFGGRGKSPKKNDRSASFTNVTASAKDSIGSRKSKSNMSVSEESRNDDLDETLTRIEIEDDAVEEIYVQDSEKNARKSTIYFDNVASKLLSAVKLGGGGFGAAKQSKDCNENNKVLSDIVATVREQIEQGSDSEAKDTLPDIIKLLNAYRGQMTEVAKKYLGSINFNKLSPTAVLYYIEREDEIKNPSWKRRQHRYSPELKIEKVHELYDALQLAQLCYADTADEIRATLNQQKKPYDLVYVNVQSSPGQPANFVAVQRDQHSFRRGFNKTEKVLSSTLRVIIGVRGTKTAADAITDLLCDTVEYNGGTAHSHIVESGKYLANKHRDLIEELRIKSEKKQVVVTLIGHSLGAGAASIAGMELHNFEANKIYQNGSTNTKGKCKRQSLQVKPTMEVKVVGFGCPAIVSEELARGATYITTVINDSDVVPRMSGVSVTNLVLDIMSFNWMEYIQRDIQHALNELQQRHSRIFQEATRQKITETIESLLQKHLNSTILKERPERMIPEVYPPGQCIHLYRDGCGITGCYVPNTFFSEIDIARRMIDGTIFSFNVVALCL